MVFEPSNFGWSIFDIVRVSVLLWFSQYPTFCFLFHFEGFPDQHIRLRTTNLWQAWEGKNKFSVQSTKQSVLIGMIVARN